MSAADRLAATLSAALGERLVRRSAEGFAALAEVVYSGEPRLPELIARPVSAALEELPELIVELCGRLEQAV